MSTSELQSWGVSTCSQILTDLCYKFIRFNRVFIRLFSLVATLTNALNWPYTTLFLLLLYILCMHNNNTTDTALLLSNCTHALHLHSVAYKCIWWQTHSYSDYWKIITCLPTLIFVYDQYNHFTTLTRGLIISEWFFTYFKSSNSSLLLFNHYDVVSSYCAFI